MRSSIAALALFLSTGSAAVTAAEIKIVSSPAASTALREVAPQFENRTGHRVVLDFTNIATTRKRIEAGEALDVAVVSPKLIDELLTQGRILPGTRLALGRTGLALMARRGAAQPDISTVDAFKRTLLDAKGVAYSATGESGIGFLSVLDRLGILAEMKPRIKAGKDMSAAMESGEVEFGVTGVGAGLSYHHLQYVGPFPADCQAYVVLAAGVSADSKKPDAARAFVKFLDEPAVVKAMAAKGVERF